MASPDWTQKKNLGCQDSVITQSPMHFHLYRYHLYWTIWYFVSKKTLHQCTPWKKSHHSGQEYIQLKIGNMILPFNVWTIQMRISSESRYQGYQTAIAYAIKAEHLPLHTAMSIPSPNALTVSAYYQLGPKFQQFPPHEFEPCIPCDKL